MLNSFLNNILLSIIIFIPILDIIIPSILLASKRPGDTEIFEDVLDDFDSEGINNEMNDGLSDNSEDSEGTLETKKKIREGISDYDRIKEERKRTNDEHSTAQDNSDHEREQEAGNRLESLDRELKDKQSSILEQKDELVLKNNSKKRKRDSDDEDDEKLNLNSGKRRKRDSDDEGDNSRRGGPSAGTTGGPSEGTGGSSGEGSSGDGSSASKEKSESPLDFVLEKESLEFPSFLDEIE
jgi:hypothetical protein